jgi:tol-pal system protein YbgF
MTRVAPIHASIRHFAFAAGLLVSTLGAAPIVSAESVDDVSDKLDRVERDLRDLQYEVYKGNPPAAAGTHVGAAPASAQANTARLADLEQSLSELHGQVETLTFQVKQLTDQLELSRKETAFRLGALEGGAPAATITPPTAALTAVPAAKAPKALQEPGGSNAGGKQPASLGSIPAGDAASADAVQTPRQQYDAAMEQLTRAQYIEAQSSFKSFVAANPKDDLAGPAQYWVGEISFTQKDYKAAAQAFADVIKRFPKTTKAPDAMLKLGLSLMELDQKKQGCTVLGAIKGRYPTAAKTILDRAAKRAAEAKCT